MATLHKIFDKRWFKQKLIRCEVFLLTSLITTCLSTPGSSEPPSNGARKGSEEPQRNESHTRAHEEQLVDPEEKSAAKEVPQFVYSQTLTRLGTVEVYSVGGTVTRKKNKSIWHFASVQASNVRVCARDSHEFTGQFSVIFVKTDSGQIRPQLYTKAAKQSPKKLWKCLRDKLGDEKTWPTQILPDLKLRFEWRLQKLKPSACDDDERKGPKGDCIYDSY